MTLREIARKFHIPYTSLRRLFAAHNIATCRIGQRKRFYTERGVPVVVYPYNLAPTDDGAELVLFVHNTVPRTIPDDYRADVCQDLLLALLTGATDSNGVGELCRSVVKHYSPKAHLVPLATVR